MTDLALPPSVVDRKRSRENFVVASRLLPRAVRDDLVTIYRFARLVDDLGDEYVGDRAAALDAIAADVDRAVIGTVPAHPALRGLVDTMAGRELPRGPFDALIAANRRDQHQLTYRTYDELLDYCRLSAVPVGELVLHVAGAADPRRLTWSADICTALQLIEHCQDVAEDQRRGRTYLPDEDLERFRVERSELATVPTPTKVRGLVAFQVNRAEALLDRGGPLVGSLRGWARAAVAGYVAGGRAAIAALRRERFAALDGSIRPRRDRRIVATVATLARGR